MLRHAPQYPPNYHFLRVLLPLNPLLPLPRRRRLCPKDWNVDYPPPSSEGRPFEPVPLPLHKPRASAHSLVKVRPADQEN